MHQQDADRARLIQTHGHREIEDPLLCDTVWKTEPVAFDVMTSSIIALIQAKRASRPVAVESPGG